MIIEKEKPKIAGFRDVVGDSIGFIIIGIVELKEDDVYVGGV